ncbi:MAG: acyl-CoA/acyl-ACP dehydrogenase, partial [Alphaproteobacteria bacterium]|nr:acyl-CoA/acyl-ACP dehydrogenase [Alphaproteobacteria bacterium]
MEFALTDDQRMMQESVGRTLERVSSLDAVRRGDSAFEALKALAVPGIMIPEEHDGQGLHLLEAALVAEQLGRHVARMPFLGSAVMAPLALRGTSWLEKLARGEIAAGVAISEHAAGARDGAGVALRNGKLEGSTLFVLDFEADVYVVAERNGALYLVSAAAKGLTRTLLPTIDATRSIGKLEFDRVEAEPLNAPPGTLARMIDAGRIVLAADTLGAAERMLEKAVAYSKERKQFDRVIASFQAVKHLCAELAAEIEPARALVWYAAYAFEALPEESRRLAAHAKAHLSEIGPFVARTATEVHGGIGF